MHLLYDNIVYSLQRYGGISTYWYELSRRAIDDPFVDIEFFENKHNHQNILRPLLKIDKAKIINGKRFNPSLERFLRLPINTPFNSDTIFHSSYFRLPVKSAKLKKICTVHDFIHDKFYKGPRVFFHNFSKTKCILESDLIITVSENTKKDLLEYYPSVNANMVLPVHNGVSDLFRPLNLISQNEYPYLLYIGSRHHYKNFDYAIKLTALSKKFHLYIVGSTLTKSEEKDVTSQLGNKYKCFTGITTKDLNTLYNRAFCLLYPSSYEGFGIPILEAMAAGCPFIAMNTSSIPEVAGNAGFLLEELELENGLLAIESIRVNYESLQKKGISRAKCFSWDKCYKDTLEVYNRLL